MALFFFAHGGFLGFALALGRFLRLDRGEVRRLFVFIKFAIRALAHPAIADRPVRDGGEERGDIPGSHRRHQRDEHQKHHQDARAEVAQKRRETARHQKVSDRSAGVVDVDFSGDVSDGSGVVADDLDDAGLADEEE